MVSWVSQDNEDWLAVQHRFYLHVSIIDYMNEQTLVVSCVVGSCYLMENLKRSGCLWDCGSNNAPLENAALPISSSFNPSARFFAKIREIPSRRSRGIAFTRRRRTNGRMGDLQLPRLLHAHVLTKGEGGGHCQQNEQVKWRLQQLSQ